MTLIELQGMVQTLLLDWTLRTDGLCLTNFSDRQRGPMTLEPFSLFMTKEDLFGVISTRSIVMP